MLVEADILHTDIVISSNLIAAINTLSKKGGCNIMLRLLRLQNLQLAGITQLNTLCTRGETRQTRRI